MPTSHCWAPHAPEHLQDITNLCRAQQLSRLQYIQAVVALQSDGCFDALKIDYKKLCAQASCVGITTTRVAIWDFNHHDQALMLPEAVRGSVILGAQRSLAQLNSAAGRLQRFDTEHTDLPSVIEAQICYTCAGS